MDVDWGVGAVEDVVVYCAGLDVHRDTVVATVRRPGSGGGRMSETRTFASTTSGLFDLGDWLIEHMVIRVGMESTGVYWKPVFYLLEERIEEVWLLNAQHLKNVPGRKTDVADSAWIAQLVEHGLVRPSFVPPPRMRELRDFTRHRRVLVEERTRTVQRLEKVLQDAGIKLTSVASTVLTKSGRAMLEEMIAGQRDPEVLAQLALGRLRSKIPQLVEALRGSFRPTHHGVLAKQLLAQVDFAESQIAQIDEEISKRCADFEDVIERVETIPGVGRKSAITMIAEIGMDMSVFPTPGHLASWAGICPGNNASGGKTRSGRTRHGPVALKTALTEAAQAAARTKNTYLAAHFHRIRSRRGTFKAIGALHDPGCSGGLGLAGVSGWV
ncbi:IS110 family transposase [Propionibacterium freudenreichii]|uniref:IS110 family transposase n=1 Tax=Propionibacterium freudenreichii TaxID=1744 RepID=UPI002A208B32|nr:IS110 family transposase [Propionibacterium freudenreichii]